MDEELILKCIIALILGYFVARMFRGNGFSVGASAPGPNCSSFKDASSCKSSGCLYSNASNLCYNPTTCNSGQLASLSGKKRKELSLQNYCNSLAYHTKAWGQNGLNHAQAAAEISNWYQNPCIFTSCATPCEISENTLDPDGKYMPTYKNSKGSWGNPGLYWTAKPKDCCDKIDGNILETGCRTPTICQQQKTKSHCTQHNCQWKSGAIAPHNPIPATCVDKPSGTSTS